MSDLREVYATELLREPTRVVLEASWDIIHRENLDTLEGEQFDSIHDVIFIGITRENVELRTVRTLKRPDRTTYRFPRNAVEHIFIPEESGHGTIV